MIDGFADAMGMGAWAQPIAGATRDENELIVAALACLFVEIVKATRTSAPTIVDHAMSLAVFIAYLVEFLTVAGAATSVFFILMAIALIDVVGGFTITIRGARRDFGYSRD